jgi:hypothetical protein
MKLGKLSGTDAIGMSDNDHLRSTEGRNRFAQVSEGEKVSTSEGIACVDKDNIKIAMEAEMLESIVQDNDFRSIHFDGKFSGLRSVGTDEDGDTKSLERLVNHPGFVSALPPISLSTIDQNSHFFLESDRAIATRNN